MGAELAEIRANRGESVENYLLGGKIEEILEISAKTMENME